jgi:hypothetical protein
MKKKIREIVREEIKATILFYLIPVDLFTFFALNEEIKLIIHSQTVNLLGI